jgi:hypothetical protein
MISNDFARDHRLTFKARGIGLYLLTHADGFRSTTASIAKANGCGLDQVRAGLQELETFGYLVRERTRDDSGHNTDTDYLITDQPQDGEPLRGETQRRVLQRRETPTHKKTKGLEDQEPQEDQKDEEEKPSRTADAARATPPPPAPSSDRTRPVQDPKPEPRPDDGEQLALLEAPGSGPGVVSITSQRDASFARFWAAYPRKTGKQDARRAWDKALKSGPGLEVLIASVEAYAAYRAGDDPRFTKHPATWLRGGCWDDELPARNARAASGDTGGGRQAFRGYDDDSIFLAPIN